jgi:ATP-dependent helicase/nuclease subunit A
MSVPERAPREAGGLTIEQEEAASRRGEPLLLSAGAGSGKTSVLVERFVRAVLEDGLAAGKILAITFTERAAGELRERVRSRFLALGEREAARDTEAAFVSTFHGFCARLLRAHALLAGLDPDFTILDEGLAGRLRDDAFKSALGSFQEIEGDPAVDVVAAYGVDQLQGMILGAHSELRSRGERVPRLPPAAAPPGAELDAGGREAAAACLLLDALLARFGEDYEALKRDRGAVDFDDLELRARELLDRNDAVRAAWSERFELLMVDEFQDTNARQLGILRALDRGNLFTVGDELQSIYGFRHAQVELFRERRAQLQERGGSLALTWNFRSRPPLLDLVNTVFGVRMGDGFTPLTAGRGRAGAAEADGAAPALGAAGAPSAVAAQEPIVELLLTSRGGWDEPALAEALAAGLPPATHWRRAEARLLAQRVRELVDEGSTRAGEVVVLLRGLADIEVYERALQLHGLRTLAVVGGFWRRLQTHDLLAYLRALANPLDEEALYETLASPLVGLSTDALALLADTARARGHGVWETARTLGADTAARLPADQSAALAAFCERFAAERRSSSERSISALIERAIDAGGYREHVLALEWGERRLANVQKLLRLARRFEAAEGRDLRAFLDHVARLREGRSTAEPDAPVDSVEPDAVRLMTIHAAKGLEFPVVCVADLAREPRGREPRLLLDGRRIGLKLLRLDGAKATPELDYAELLAERKRAQAAEEDRVLYVAMTRARERLLLSGAVDFEAWPTEREGSAPITWLAPALAGNLALPLHAGDPVSDLLLEGGERPVVVRARLNSPQRLGEVLRLGARAGAPSGGGPSGGGPSAGAGEAGGGGRGAPAQQHGAAAPQAAGRGGAPAEDEAQLQLELGLEAERAMDVEVDQEASAGGETTRGEASTAQPGPLAVRDPAPAAVGAAAVPAPARSGAAAPEITTLSYTSLSELERCGYRYYLERVLGLGEDRAAARAQGEPGLEARARGTLAHSLLETLDFARPAPPSAAEVAARARELGIRAAEPESREIASLLAAALSSQPAARIAAALELRRERPFAFSLGTEEPLVTGVIDLLARERTGGVLVIDYKSDRVGPEEDLEEHVERDYGVQRLLYALAVLRDGAPSVEIAHWFLERPGKWVARRYEAGERGALEAELAARLERARARGFAVSDEPHRGLCLTCPGRGALCSWEDAQTMREQPPGAPARPAGALPGA